MLANYEYKFWKKHAPHQYDFMVLHSLDLPSYSYQWLPKIDTDDNHTIHYAIICANSEESDQCKLLKIKV